jgi:uncharacterized protein YktB (UPF0637 family)
MNRDKFTRVKGGYKMTAFAQIISLLFFVSILFFLISIVNFMKAKTRNDEILIRTLEKVLERLPERKKEGS